MPYAGGIMNKVLGDIITSSDVMKLCNIFKINPSNIETLKKSNRCVYEVSYNDKKFILKVFNAHERKQDEIQGEIDFVLACIKENIETYLPIKSINNVALEQCNLSQGQSAFAFMYEKVEGFEVEEDADAFKEFTPKMLENWGRLLGKIHTVSNKFTTKKISFSRPKWYEVSDLDFNRFLPEDDKIINNIFDKLTKRIKSLPKSDKNYGLVHGDLHYGNFLITNSGLAVLDFDSSSYYYYAADIAIALYSLLPYPRYRRKERKKFAETFFKHFLNGYLKEYALPEKELDNIPLFLECEDMANYIALYRHWDMNNLTKNQKRILKRNRYHIINRIPLY